MDRKVQQSVISQLRGRPEVVEVGPFVLGWDPDTDSRFINYATPRLDASITAADVAALVATFRELGRIPRLEYVTSCAPDLERLLLAAGFTVEARHIYLLCTPDSLAAPPVPAGFTLAEPATDDERAAVVAVQNEAFGGELTATPAEIARTRRTQDRGGVVMLARHSDGRCVGAGQATPPAEGLTEVTGIAVRKEFRRRGVGGALTAAVTARAFAAGARDAWLEVSGEDAWRIYRRIGFVPTGTRLYVALE